MTWKPGETFEEFLIRRENRRVRLEAVGIITRILIVSALVSVCLVAVLR